jgi:hypothetical protein
MRTRRELIDQTLDNLGVLVPGQTPSSENVSRVDRIFDPLVATMAAQDIYYLGDAGTPNPPAGGEIPDEAFLQIAAMSAWAVAGGFNLADSASLKVLNDQAIVELRQMSRPAATRQTLSTDRQLRGMRNIAFGGNNFVRGN